MPVTITAALQQVQSAWQQIHAGSTPVALPTAAEAGRRMAQYLLQNQFMLVIDLQVLEHVFVSPGVQALLGCPPADFNLAWLYSRVHPDDASLLGQATALSARWLNERRHEALGHVFTADYRLRHQAGHYLRVLRHNFPLDFGHDGTPTVAGSKAVFIVVAPGKGDNLSPLPIAFASAHSNVWPEPAGCVAASTAGPQYLCAPLGIGRSAFFSPACPCPAFLPSTTETSAWASP